MKFCGKCGNQLDDDMMFCNQCGTACYYTPDFDPNVDPIIPEAPVAKIDSETKAPESSNANMDSIIPEAPESSNANMDSIIPEAPESSNANMDSIIPEAPVTNLIDDIKTEASGEFEEDAVISSPIMDDLAEVAPSDYNPATPNYAVDMLTQPDVKSKKSKSAKAPKEKKQSKAGLIIFRIILVLLMAGCVCTFLYFNPWGIGPFAQKTSAYEKCIDDYYKNIKDGKFDKAVAASFEEDIINALSKEYYGDNYEDYFAAMNKAYADMYTALNEVGKTEFKYEILTVEDIDKLKRAKDVKKGVSDYNDYCDYMEKNFSSYGFDANTIYNAYGVLVEWKLLVDGEVVATNLKVVSSYGYPNKNPKWYALCDFGGEIYEIKDQLLNSKNPVLSEIGMQLDQNLKEAEAKCNEE